ncbi:hypothetical protein D3C81_2153190 [compost metagenome]
MPKITVRNAAIKGVLNIDLSSITSVRLAPALPIIRAITAPVPMPLSIKTDANGITASARIYKGIPITALNGIANGLSCPA